MLASGVLEIFSSSSRRARACSASRRESSAATRDWMWSSRSFERVLSVCGHGSSQLYLPDVLARAMYLHRSSWTRMGYLWASLESID